MEQEDKKDTAQPSEQSSKKDVTFPGSKKKKKGGKGLLIVIAVLIIAAIGAGVWFIFSEPEVDDDFIATTSPTPVTSESTPTPTQEPIERSEIRIQVLNGTGIGGQAASTQEELEDLGYEDIEIGNADNQDFEAMSITFDEDVPQGVRDEIVSAFEEIFEEVDSEESELSDFDVVIITGYPTGHTPTPTDAPTATSTPTPTATESGSTSQ